MFRLLRVPAEIRVKKKEKGKSEKGKERKKRCGKNETEVEKSRENSTNFRVTRYGERENVCVREIERERESRKRYELSKRFARKVEVTLGRTSRRAEGRKCTCQRDVGEILLLVYVVAARRDVIATRINFNNSPARCNKIGS